MAKVNNRPEAKDIFTNNRIINAGPMWDIIKQRATSTPQMRHAYNRMQSRNPYGRMWPPTYEQLAEVLELVGLSARELYAEIGITKLLSDEDKVFLDELECCEEYQLSFLWKKESILNDGWYQKYTGPDFATPGGRLLDYLRTFDEGPLSDCSSISKMYSRRQGDTIPEEHLADYFLGSIRRLIKLTIPTEIIPEIAEKTDLSARWILCWSLDKSFYGYDPMCEMIFDSYKLCPPNGRAVLRSIVHQFAATNNSANKGRNAEHGND